MTFRRGIYIVPTNRWYIERTVWLISGLVLLASTALAAFVNEYLIGFVTIAGLISMSVALNGYCPVGNVLYFLGFEPMLAEKRVPRPKLYRMRTDSWYLERRIYLIVGFNLTLSSVLTIVHSHWWWAFTGFVGAASLFFASTGFCIMANGFYWTGAEPRLAPEYAAGDPRRVPVAGAPATR